MAAKAFRQAANDTGARQAHGNFGRLLAEAREARPQLETFGAKLADRFDCEFEIGPLKKPSEYKRKANEKYAGDVARVLDGVRGFAVFEDYDTAGMQAMMDYFNPANNPEVAQFKDKINHPTATGFRSCNVYVPMKNGHIAEIMILSRSTRESYDQSHGIYKDVSRISRRFNDVADMPAPIRAQHSALLDAARRLQPNAPAFAIAA